MSMLAKSATGKKIMIATQSSAVMGKMFPSDPRWKNASTSVLANVVVTA